MAALDIGDIKRAEVINAIIAWGTISEGDDNNGCQPV